MHRLTPHLLYESSMDRRMRDLERRASEGDEEAEEALDHMKKQAGWDYTFHDLVLRIRDEVLPPLKDWADRDEELVPTQGPTRRNGPTRAQRNNWEEREHAGTRRAAVKLPQQVTSQLKMGGRATTNQVKKLIETLGWIWTHLLEIPKATIPEIQKAMSELAEDPDRPGRKGKPKQDRSYGRGHRGY